MAYRIISTSQAESDYQQITALDGVDYVLRFRWNTRARAWFCGIWDTDGTVIAAPRKLVLGAIIFRYNRAADDRMPQGIFYLVDVTDSGIDAGLRDLGTRVFLCYAEQAEVEALVAELAAEAA
jgi:hypothetical protein